MRNNAIKIPKDLPERASLPLLLSFNEASQVMKVNPIVLRKGLKPGGKYSTIRSCKFGGKTASIKIERDSVLAFIYQKLDAAG